MYIDYLYKATVLFQEMENESVASREDTCSTVMEESEEESYSETF